jgi:hypothetical protein
MIAPLRWLRARLAERSTWIGLSAVGTTALGSLGQYLAPAETHTIAVAVVAAGIVAAIMSSGGATANPPPAGPPDGPADPAQP